ncbi:HicB-like antitoxin of toxin-antitoxin system [Caulobacteraceae bacterium]
MHYYHGVVQKDADSAFGVSFPDLEGCFSAADDLESVVREATDAVSLYLEGNDRVIEPSSIETIRDLAKEDLANGAFLLILVPHIAASNTPTRINISLDSGILAAIDTAASARKLTRSAFLAQAARNEIVGR